ncbi:MAG: hypothetical protein ACREAE_05805, partial [Nitrosopumilaceae archaeon]
MGAILKDIIVCLAKSEMGRWSHYGILNKNMQRYYTTLGLRRYHSQRWLKGYNNFFQTYSQGSWMILSKDTLQPVHSLLEVNILKGKVGEKIAETDYKNNGYIIIRTGIGSDFLAIKRDAPPAKPYLEYVEVKTGKSKLSKRQRMAMKKAKKSGKGY